MTEKTFLNLPLERQQEIIRESYREFIRNNYQSASLSRLIKNLNLAKGSFYRYFTSKKNLYNFLTEKAMEGRMQVIQRRIEEFPADFFSLIENNLRDKIHFDMTCPLESAFLYRVSRERDVEELGDMEMSIKRNLVNMVKEMLINQYQNDIRKDIDPDLIAFLVVQVQFGLYDYLALKHNDDMLSNIKAGKALYTVSETELEEMVRSFSNLMKTGIK